MSFKILGFSIFSTLSMVAMCVASPSVFAYSFEVPLSTALAMDAAMSAADAVDATGPAAVRVAETDTQAIYEKALELYTQRSPVDPQVIDQAIAKLEKIEGKADQAELNYRILILESQSLYFRASHSVNKDEKKRLFLLGQAKAEAAKKLNDNYAEGYYYAGINLARWGEVQGAVSAIGKKGELLSDMNEALKRKTVNGDAGETLDGYGIDRTLGRLYFKLPYLLGGSRSKSLEHLQKAYFNASNLAMNALFLAETLADGKAADKAHAKQILDEMLAHDPNTFCPSRVVETKEEFEQARELRAHIK